MAALSWGSTLTSADDYRPPLPGEPAKLPEPILGKPPKRVIKKPLNPRIKKAKVKEEEVVTEPVEAPPAIAPTYKPELEPTHIPADVGSPTSAFVHAPSFDYSAVTPEFVLDLICNRGIPVVLRNNFSFEWLERTAGDTSMRPRDNVLIADLDPIPLREYLQMMRDPSKQQTRLLYGKDLPAPEEWKAHVLNHLPVGWRWLEHGDLLGDIPRSGRPESVMTYIGYEGTRTPGHLDLCSTIGHNIMLYAEKDSGASWYIAAKNDLRKVETLWDSYGHSIHEDNFFMPYECLSKASFKFFVVDQREGDLVLVPPDSAHQGLTIKLAWNRVPVYLVSQIIKNTIPIHCKNKKAQVYRVKYAVMCALKQRTKAVEGDSSANSVVDLLQDFPTLLSTFEEVVRCEWLPTYPKSDKREKIQVDADDRQTCDVCSGDIFNRYIKLRTNPDVAAKLRDKEHRPSAMAMAMAPVMAQEDVVMDGEMDVCLHCTPEVFRVLRAARLQESVEEAPTCFLVSTYRWSELVDVLYAGFKAYEKLCMQTHVPPLGRIPQDINELKARLEKAESTLASMACAFLTERYCHICKKDMEETIPCHKCRQLTCNRCQKVPKEICITCSCCPCTTCQREIRRTATS